MSKIGEQMQELEEQLSKLPTRQELESLERYAEEICARIDANNADLSMESKRNILELMHVKVWISEDYRIRITGWLGDLGSVSYKVR